MNHARRYLNESAIIASQLDAETIERMAEELRAIREQKGRLYLVGLGGSAANCSHASADFRNLCGIDAVSAGDSVAELTASANDDSWSAAFTGALRFAKPGDALMVLSVGGGADGVSVPLIAAVELSLMKAMRVYGIVGRDGGWVAKRGHCVLIVPTLEPERVTPHTEGFQMVVLHCLVSHPSLQEKNTKW